MNLTELPQSEGSSAAVQTLIATGSGLNQTHDTVPSLAGVSPKVSPRPSGYGMPCIKCKTYYAADLEICPVCQSSERVSPTFHAMDTAAATLVEESPDLEVIEREREKFLQEFKTHMLAANLQINASSSFRCSREENHEGSFESAAVCQGCYDHLRERADQLEAALLIDLKDAAQVIYEAVWSDPSDPSKTYQNAAMALLCELRKRAGVSTVFGTFQPLQH